MHLPPVTLVVHGLSDLLEASNVAAGNQRRELALGGSNVLLGSLEAVLEAVLHDLLELLVDLLGGPLQALRVLGHLKTGNGDTTSVGGLTRSVPDGRALLLLSRGLEDVNGLLGATHVGTLGDELGTLRDESLSLVGRDLILGS